MSVKLSVKVNIKVGGKHRCTFSADDQLYLPKRWPFVVTSKIALCDVNLPSLIHGRIEFCTCAFYYFLYTSKRWYDWGHIRTLLVVMSMLVFLKRLNEYLTSQFHMWFLRQWSYMSKFLYTVDFGHCYLRKGGKLGYSSLNTSTTSTWSLLTRKI